MAAFLDSAHLSLSLSLSALLFLWLGSAPPSGQHDFLLQKHLLDVRSHMLGADMYECARIPCDVTEYTCCKTALPLLHTANIT